MPMLYPLMLDGGQPVGEVRELLQDAERIGEREIVLVRHAERLGVSWYVAPVVPLREALSHASATASLASVMVERPVTPAADAHWNEASRVELHGTTAPPATATWQVVFRRSRFIGVIPPVAPQRPTTGDAIAPPPAAPIPAAPVAPTSGGTAAPAQRGATRGLTRAKPRPAAAAPTPAGAAPPATAGADGPAGVTDTLLAVARVELPASLSPAPTAHAPLLIGLAPAPSPAADDVMRFESAARDTTLAITVLVEAPDFTCAAGWKHTLTVQKADPFAATVALDLVPRQPEDRTARVATVRVHYSYGGQPAGIAVRTIALGDVTASELAAIPAPTGASLTIAPTVTPVDLTIRIARRDGSDTARELIWTIVDCAIPGIDLPDAPMLQTVGDRENASSFAALVTRQVNAADGTPKVDNMLCSVGTLIRRAMPTRALAVLSAVHAAIPDRLPRVLLLTDECHVPWELAYLDTPPDPARAPFLGAQYAISRWIHGEEDIPVPPPATLAVRDLAIVLGSYEQSSLAPLPHARDETAALTAEAAQAPARFPRVTSVEATADLVIDLLNGALPAPTGPLAPEMVHFACHGEVLGTGVAKRSVLYLNDGSALEETLFVSSRLARTRRSFLFMNACQVGVGGETLGQYAGFAGFAIGAGFSGFIGPLWSVNDEVAKRIAVDFYRRSFGTDGAPARPVADLLADMRSQYLTEPDPKKRQSTWLAYVHYGHPHFTLTLAH